MCGKSQGKIQIRYSNSKNVLSAKRGRHQESNDGGLVIVQHQNSLPELDLKRMGKSHYSDVQGFSENVFLFQNDVLFQITHLDTFTWI